VDGLGTTEWEQVLVRDAERRWLAHRFTCPKAGGVRTAVHDAIARIWADFLRAAGFHSVSYEPRRWDAEAGTDEANHRRPDITAIHPVTLQTWVFDVTLSWQELADVAVTALGARNRENWKVRSYAGAMDRRVTEAAEGGAAVPEGWLEHVFLPLGYEATGAWGPKADYAFGEVVKAYQATRAGNIDKHEFRFGDYWEQAISAAILRGQAAVAGRAKWPRELQAPPGGEHHADMGA
jgi:hypothetical protein